MSNCLVCNKDISADIEFGGNTQLEMVGDYDGFTCSSSCKSRYDQGIRHGSTSSYGIKCTGCGCDMSRASTAVYSAGDYDPFCSNSCQSAHSCRIWSDM